MRALAVRQSSVPAAERAAYLARARVRRDACAARGCRFWLFEATAEPGAFTEFMEAANADILSAALAEAATDEAAGDEPGRVLREVPLG